MTAPTPASPSVCCEHVANVTCQGKRAIVVLASGRTLRLLAPLASYVARGDKVAFPGLVGDTPAAEILISKGTDSGATSSIYLVPIGYVSRPKSDKRGEHFVSAEINRGALGIRAVRVSSEALRDYFYCLPSPGSYEGRPSLYELLNVKHNAAPAEMRVAFQLRRLELETRGASPRRLGALERAFNLLAQPDLRACYDALLSDPRTPAIFPHGGFGSLLVRGERSRDGATFFARRILAFRPESRHLRFHLPIRRCEFYEDRALCRDVGRRLEFWIDPALLHLPWNAGWQRWKHLLGAKMEVEATFVRSGRYRKRNGGWELIRWETGLPSRLKVRLPSNFEQLVEKARTTHHRFGQYSRALDQVRMCLDQRALEKSQIERMCTELCVPGDFDITQISWRPDYDEFFYRQLAHRAQHIYLFRGEYIFDLDNAVVIETPQRGHATYVFRKPRSMESFLSLYTRCSKDDLRNNRDNAGERLGFLKRVMHGSDPHAWLQELRHQMGEEIDFASAMRD